MNLLQIPIDIDKFNINSDDEIDMGNLHYINIEKPLLCALICLRNTGTKLRLNFDNCSYEDKAEYLRLFLSSNIDVYLPQLSSTWIEILTYEIDSTIYMESILSKEEIEKFINENDNFINKVRRLINSLPYLALSKYINQNDAKLDMSGVPSIYDDEIKLMNLYQLTEYNSFILLLDDKGKPERVGGYYHMFDEKSNEYNIYRLLDGLPFFNIITALLGTNEIQSSLSNEFLNKIENNKEVIINGNG